MVQSELDQAAREDDPGLPGDAGVASVTGQDQNGGGPISFPLARSRRELPMDQPQAANPAQVYEQYFVPAMFLPWATILLRHAALARGERVLDVACGTGIVSREAAPLVGEAGKIVGLDVNPVMLGVARAASRPSGANIEWQEGNAMALPFADDSFDVVLCQHGLQFFPDRPGAVREMRRVLSDGGRALAIVLQAREKHPVFSSLMESVARHLGMPLTAVSTPFALDDADDLRGLFTSAGFTSVNVHPETATISFPLAERFVPLAVASSAAAVPAFAQLAAPDREALMRAVRADVEPTLRAYRRADAIEFPMFAHVAVAST